MQINTPNLGFLATVLVGFHWRSMTYQYAVFRACSLTPLSAKKTADTSHTVMHSGLATLERKRGLAEETKGGAERGNDTVIRARGVSISSAYT